MDKAFVVDSRLGAVRLDRVLDVRDKLRNAGRIGNEGSTGADRPLVENEILEPGKLYPSSRYPQVRYYLPRYVLATDERGEPEVVLRFTAGSGGQAEDDSGEAAEVGRLTLTLTWTPPSAARNVELRMMDHVASLGLRYRIPVRFEDSDADASEGGWEETIRLQPLEQRGEQRATSTTVFTDKATFDKVYQAMSKPDRDATLELSIVAPVGIRTWNQIVVGKAAEKDQAVALQRQKALFTKMVTPATLATINRSGASVNRAHMRVVAPADDEAERVEAMRAVLASPGAVNRLGAAAGHRPDVVVATQPGTRAALARAARANPQTRANPPARPNRAARVNPRTGNAAVRRRPDPNRVVATRVMTASTTVAPAVRVSATPVAHVATVAAAANVQPAAANVQPAAANVQPAAANARARPAAVTAVDPERRKAVKALARVNAPSLREAVLASNVKVAGVKAVPLELALDKDKKPAIVDTELECAHELPFRFPPAEHRNVYATGDFEPSAPHVLLRLLLPSGEHVYQDNLMPDVVHVVPSSFRLVRDEHAPYLPTLSLLASNFGTTEDDVEAEVLFRVALVYRLEPWVDPEVVEEATAMLARDGEIARPTTIVPRDAKLTLEVADVPPERAEAWIDPAVGITDTLKLEHEAFLRLWQTALGIESGIRGRVEFTLFDGTAATAGVNISFWETSTEVFDTQFLGASGSADGRYRVRVRNRVESPVRVARLPGEPVGDGEAMALAVDAGSVLGKVLQPQEQLEIEYQVTPAETPVATVTPTIVGETQPDLGMLLKLLMETSGYSALSFSITVRAAEGLFGTAAAGEEPLTGLQVEFDDGTRVELSADDEEVEVTLVGRLIDQILGGAGDEQRYFYRVTSLHPSGEGARSGWEQRSGTAPLVVGVPVGELTLDF